MKKSLALALLASCSIAPLMAQTASAADPAARPRFAVLRSQALYHYARTPAALPTWSGTITYKNNPYKFTMVGTDPSSSNVTTTYPVYIIPVKMVYSKASYGTKYVFNPNKDQWNGATITKSLENSPLFNSLDWNWGGTDFGTTQYEDAFQRGSFWGDGISTTNTNYHVVFATPTVLPLQTINVTPGSFNNGGDGGAIITNPFGAGKVGEMDINAFDNFIQKTLSKYSSKINPTVFPLFVVENIFLTSGGGCCIGGYHDADSNGQTYAMASFVTDSGSFSQDISAFSHELGEWYDDPLITSNSPCGLLETGDPLEGLTNYGTFAVTFNNITYHPQALAWMEYFGEPANFSGNNWLDNQHLLSSVCQHGQ